MTLAASYIIVKIFPLRVVARSRTSVTRKSFGFTKYVLRYFLLQKNFPYLKERQIDRATEVKH